MLDADPGRPLIYANEIDKNAAHWLSCLPLPIDRIDDRSIADVKGSEIDGFKQCHFFAGIGGWPLALAMAGWPTDAPVWTGSCPCQPFSAAGKRKGTADERHLWPEFLRLIDQCRPATIFGEQVASKDGRNWLATVRADLEALGYAVGAADLSAAGAGAPHIRQRLFWVAYCGGSRLEGRKEQPARQECHAAKRGGDAWRLGDSTSSRSLSGSLTGIHQSEEGGRPRNGQPQRPSGANERLGDSKGNGWQQGRAEPNGRNIATTDSRLANDDSYRCDQGRQGIATQEHDGLVGNDTHCGMGDTESVGSVGGIRCESGEPTWDRGSMFAGSDHWSDIEFIPCRDGKARPVKPGIRLLAHGIPGRVAQLRGLGNAIVPQVAAEFIAAFMESVSIK